MDESRNQVLRNVGRVTKKQQGSRAALYRQCFYRVTVPPNREQPVLEALETGEGDSKVTTMAVPSKGRSTGGAASRKGGAGAKRDELFTRLYRQEENALAFEDMVSGGASERV